MRKSFRVPRLASIATVLATSAIMFSTLAAPATSSSDRLFQSFIEDATVVENQWWEAQLEFADYEALDLTILRGIVAFQPWRDVEVGGRMGFADSDIPGSSLDGSGATDLDAWMKYFFGADGGETEFAAGGILTVPTGDDTAGLGADAFGLKLFGSLRHTLDRLVLSVNAGLQINGDGKTLGSPEFDGETAPSVGVAVIYPHSDRITFTGEATFSGERFNGGDTDSRVIAGMTWRPANRGMVRAAISVGLSDGAPDTQLIAGYAAQF